MAQYRIKELLKERGMTQKELAQKIGVSAVTLNRYMTGNPSVSSLEKIADALGVGISELFVHREYCETDFRVECPHCHRAIHVIVRGEEYGKESI